MSNLSFEVKRLHKLSGESKLKAFADVVISELFLVKGVRVVEGKNGLFVGMPREQGKNGQWYATAYALDEDIKEELDKIVLAAYHQ